MGIPEFFFGLGAAVLLGALVYGVMRAGRNGRARRNRGDAPQFRQGLS